MKKTLALMVYTVLVGLPVPLLAEEDWVNLTATTGAGLYGEKCGMCHREGGMGHGILSRRMDPALASLENREDLQGAFIENVVRNGFGTMFPISRGEVSDAQLAAITTYLVEKDPGHE